METDGGQRVFFSYASADRARAEKIIAALTARGYPVWWDRHIEGGTAYARMIEGALFESEVVIVAWSRASLDSNWVRDEAEYGRDHRRLVPIRLDEVEPPIGFRQYQMVDFTAWDGRPDSAVVTRLVSAIERSQPAEAPGAPAPATRRRTLSRRSALIASAAAAPALAAGVWWFGWGDRRAPPLRSIAVLPFANLSGDPAQDYFSDGLSEELISALARLNSLQVIARTSSFPFRGDKVGSREIGARLGVAYILDGSVRRGGATVRVTAQLVEAATGIDRWSQSFDRELKDILGVETGIAQAVAEALAVRLLSTDIAALNLGGAANEEAYDDYLHGRHLFDAGGDETAYRAALAAFDSAIAADNAFAAAHAARGRTLLVIANQFTPPAQLRATFDAALASARQAVAFAPDLAEAQATLGAVLQNANLDFVGAKQAFARALSTGSGSADILTRCGQFTCDLGDFAAGLPAVTRASVLDPLNPRVFRSLGYALIEARRFAEGVAAMQRALQLSPAAEGAHAAIGDARLLQGDLAGAQKEYALEPLSWLRQTGQAIASHREGDQAAAARAFKALTAAGDDTTLYQQAQVFAQWGEPDRAMAALQQARASGDSGLVLMKVDPMLDPLRRDRRYLSLQHQLGLDG